MAAVRNLCKHGIVLQNGSVICDSSINNAVDFYLHNGTNETKTQNEIKDSITQLVPYITIDYISFNGQTSNETTISAIKNIYK